MTKDEALRLALEALENSHDLVRENAYSAEQLYGNYPARQGKVRGLKVLADDHEKAITAIKAALEAKDEPVIDQSAAKRIATALGWEPKRRPLTDEEIDKVMAENKQTLIDATDNYWNMRRAYARIIEAAHGIKELP